jgi:beta-N-acetylhexosaminidase
MRLRLPPRLGLRAFALAGGLIAIAVVLATRSRSAHPARAPGGHGRESIAATGTRQSAGSRRHRHPGAAGAATGASAAALDLRRQVGQLIIGTYAGTVPHAPTLDAVRAGELGGIILTSSNTAGGTASVAAAVRRLQAAARAGGNPGLLIMTDQEGGEVKRLPGPPTESARQMGAAGDAGAQARQTAALLKSLGVNVDLAPVADVARVDGFIARSGRSFGSDPSAVATAACAFAAGLSGGGVAYTLKHFPGLGSALGNTDDEPVNVREPLAEIEADDAAYRSCARGPLALVMVSSASYANLTGSAPAVLDPGIYSRFMPEQRVDAVTISDSFESGAIDKLETPALRAIDAGLDMVLYPGHESVGADAFRLLLADAQRGRLHRARLADAVAKILALKRALELL